MPRCPFLYIGEGRRDHPDNLPPWSANTDIQVPSGDLKIGQPITVNVVVRNDDARSATSLVRLYWSYPLTHNELHKIDRVQQSKFPKRPESSNATTISFSWTPSSAEFGGASAADVHLIAHVEETGQVEDPTGGAEYCPINSAYVPDDANDYQHPCRAVYAVHIVS